MEISSHKFSQSQFILILTYQLYSFILYGNQYASIIYKEA